jgi:hypothetical protein
MQPTLLWIRCPKCGWPHQEYFGPRNRDATASELKFLRRALAVSFEVLRARSDPPSSPGRRASAARPRKRVARVSRRV